MELKQFVQDSLTQILDGITGAQKHALGGHVAANGFYGDKDKSLYNSKAGIFTIVDFDISVVAGTKEGGGSVRVSSVETQDGSVKAAQNSSRVRFSVHLKIPDGDPEPREKEGPLTRGYRPGV